MLRNVLKLRCLACLRELKLRKEEILHYGYLGDERSRGLLQDAINYGERRMIKLESHRDLTQVQASLAHLE